MDLILALEPDVSQAAVLSRMLPDRVGADLIVAASAAAAVASLADRRPVLLLVGESVDAADREQLVAALNADSLPQLSIPRLRIEQEAPRRSWRLPFGRQRDAAPVEGWDPTLFAEQVATCLDKARKQACVSVVPAEAPRSQAVEADVLPLPDDRLEPLDVDPVIPDAAGVAVDADPEPAPAHDWSPAPDGPVHEPTESAPATEWPPIAPADDPWTPVDRGPIVWPDAPAEESSAAAGAAHAEEPQPESFSAWDPRALDLLPSLELEPAVPTASPDSWTAMDDTEQACAEEAFASAWSEATGDPADDAVPGAPVASSLVSLDDAMSPHEAGVAFDALDRHTDRPPPADAFASLVPHLDTGAAEDLDSAARQLGLTVPSRPAGDGAPSSPDGMAAHGEALADDDDFEEAIRRLGMAVALEEQRADAPGPAGPALHEWSDADAAVVERTFEPSFEIVPEPGTGDELSWWASAAAGGGVDDGEEITVDLDGLDGERQGDDRRSGEDVVDAEVHAAEIALVEVRAEERLTQEVERVRAEAAERHARELARVASEAAAAREAAVMEAREAAEAEARAALARELARVRGEAEDKLAGELARVREEAAHNLAEQVGRTRAEADQMLEAQLARAQSDIEAVRASAVEEARLAAESTSARALEAEVERVRAESEARLEAELARVRAEADQIRLAHEQAQRDVQIRSEEAARAARAAADAEAERRLATEVERAKAEAEAKLGAELARLQQQAEALWFAEQESRLEAEQARDAASHQAKLAADAAAARAVEVEIARVRAESDARLQAELAQLRAEADEARRAREEAEQQAVAAREAAARDARLAAQAAASRAVSDEAARLRQEADARLAAETERARREAEARLNSEIAAFTAQSERRRQQELQELRSQMAQLRDAALRQDHVRPEELVMAGGYHPAWPEPARAKRSTWLSESTWPRKAAAIAVIVAATSFVVDVPGLARSVVMTVAGHLGYEPPPPVDTSDPLAAILPPGTPLTPEPPPAAARPRAQAPRAQPSAAPAPRAVSPPVTGSSGTLNVFSRLPLEVYSGTRRIGSTEGPLVLPAGWHDLRLVSNRYNFREEIAIEIRGGTTLAHTVTLPTSLLRIRSAAGAEVLVDGQVVGRAPLVEVPVQIGTREVLVRHPDLGTRRATVEVRHELTAEVILALDRAVDGPARTPQLPPLSRAPVR